jgi:hypothetical protein
VELKALYKGYNNGDQFLSVREAARRLNVSKSFAAELFQELAAHGFTRAKEVGAFNLKALAGKGKATTWILTEFPVGDALQGTRDFMRWAPVDLEAASIATAENHFAVHTRGRSVHTRGPLAPKQRPNRPNRPPLRTLSSILRAKRSTRVDTGIATMEGGVASQD